MFLRPQHFQQHDRWLERFIELRGGSLRNHPWGFVELHVERDNYPDGLTHEEVLKILGKVKKLQDAGFNLIDKDEKNKS